MGLRQSISNCKKPINQVGSSRNVYYSKKYNLVYKKDKNTSDQTKAEINIFNQMTLEEKQIIPMVGVEYFNNKPVIIMEYVKILSSIKVDGLFLHWDTLSCFSLQGLKQQLESVIHLLGLKNNINEFCEVVTKYQLLDLSRENVGVYNGQLVIIDFGVNANMYQD